MLITLIGMISTWYLVYFILTFHLSIRLRGTTQGANNRMDLLALLTSGVNDNEVNGPDEDILGVVERWGEDETHNPDVPAISHKRGLTPFVFVSFEEVSLSFKFVRRSPFFHIKQKECPVSHLTISLANEAILIGGEILFMIERDVVSSN